MLNAFFLTLCLVLLPTSLLCYFHSKKVSPVVNFPICLGILFGFQCISSALLYRFPYGFFKTGFVVLLSTGLTHLFLNRLLVRNPLHSVRLNSFKYFAWLSALVLWCLWDNFYILGHHGWSFQEGGLWPLKESYFRGPLNTDAERNVILVNALLRGGVSPFLPDSLLSYQTLIFYFMALVASHFQALTLYPYVGGISQGIFALFLFGFLSALFLYRPRLLNRPILVVGILFIFFSHTDFSHLLLSKMKTGNWGIEADGSFLWVFFRNFSLKLTALLSPHHLCFFMFLGLFLLSERIVSRGSMFQLRSLSFVFSFLVSPIFTVLFYPFWLAGQIYHFQKLGLKAVLRVVGSVALAVGLHWLILRFSVLDLFFRQVRGDLSWFSIPYLSPKGMLALVSLPLLWFCCLGSVGIWLTVLLLKNKLRRMEYLLLLIVGNVFVYYVYRGAELQRHFTILSFFISCLAILRIMSLDSAWASRFVGALVLLTIPAHAYFIYSFTQKENLIEPEVSYQDYFVVNQVLRERFPGMPTLAAISFKNGGFPIAMEATTSFSTPMDGFIYHRLNQSKVDILFKSWAQLSVIPYASEMGYQAILWGPVEDRVWGVRTGERFVDSKNLMFQYKSVSVYRLEDKLRKQFSEQTVIPKGSAAYYEKFGNALFLGGWFQEAFDAYTQALALEPSRVGIKEKLASLMLPKE